MSGHNNHAQAQPDNSVAPQFMNYKEAARYLGIPIGTLYSWVHKQRVPHVRFGPRQVRFSRVRLEEWIAAQEVPVKEQR